MVMMTPLAVALLIEKGPSKNMAVALTREMKSDETTPSTMAFFPILPRLLKERPRPSPAMAPVMSQLSVTFSHLTIASGSSESELTITTAKNIRANHGTDILFPVFSPPSSLFSFQLKKSSMKVNGTMPRTRIILTVEASGSTEASLMALPAAATCATSCIDEPAHRAKLTSSGPIRL